MLSVILANSAPIAPSCEPFEITLSYNNQPVDYWILRGELPGAYAVLHDHEFIALRGRYDEGQLPLSWEEIESLILAGREEQEVGVFS